MASQWYANPTYNHQHQNQVNSNWNDAVLMQEDYSDLESSMAMNANNPNLLQSTSLTLKDDLQKKQVSNLPPFDVPPKLVSSTCQPLSVRLQLKRDIFTTTSLVEGHLELVCLKESSAPKVGKIAVYLVGFEETRKSKTRNFLVKKWIIQDPKFAPSEAVHAGPLDEDGMWAAKKGSHTFPFAIPFERDEEDLEGVPGSDKEHILTDVESDSPLPSSYWNPKVGGVRYVLAAVVETKISGKVRNPIAFYQEIFVVENAGYTLSPTYANLSARTQCMLKEAKATVHSGFLGLGKKGDVQLGASLRTLRIQAHTQDAGVWKSGENGFIGIDIQNNSAKKVVLLDVTLVRILKTFKFDSVGYRPVSFSKLATTKTTMVANKKRSVQRGSEIRTSVARGWQEMQDGNQIKEWSGVPPDSSLKVLVHLNIPNWARTIRNASLIDVSFEVVVKIVTVGGKTVEVAIPITILHPSSVLEEIPKVDILAPPEISKEVSGHVSYINIDPRNTATRTPSPTRPDPVAVAQEIADQDAKDEQDSVDGENDEQDQDESFQRRRLHRDEEPLPAPQPLENIKSQLAPEAVFTSQTTLADSNSSLGDKVSPISFGATKRSSTINTTTRKSVAPLKSFVAISRSSTARRTGAGPVVSRPSPAALKAMAASIPEPTVDAPSVVNKEAGARKLFNTTNLDEIDAKFDLDSEIDKMFSVVQMS